MSSLSLTTQEPAPGAPSLHYSFEGKRVLVTGGGRGIGEAIVKKFYNDGAQVYVLDKDARLLSQLQSKLPKVSPICVDLLDWTKTRAAIEALPAMDHLVNNAAIVGEGPLLEASPETFDEIFGVNVKGMLNVSQVFVKNVIKNGTTGATIVNLSSLGDRIAAWGSGCYGSSKAAVTMLTKSMALEFGEYGIRVNCVNPTIVDTELRRQLSPELLSKSAELQGRVIIKGRLLQASDVADSVLFLSSPLASMITGTSLLVDLGTRAI